MRLSMVFIVLVFVFAQACSQQGQKGQHGQHTHVEFTPATNNFLPFINSYSPEDGLKQYYLKDAAWVRNEAIPNFQGDSAIRNMGVQYFSQGGTPQLFVYSKSSGDFKFYYLTTDGWVVNEIMPTGKIGIASNRISATFSPASNAVTSYIFSHSVDGSKVELLEVVDNTWTPTNYFPQDLPN